MSGRRFTENWIQKKLIALRHKPVCLVPRVFSLIQWSEILRKWSGFKNALQTWNSIRLKMKLQPSRLKWSGSGVNFPLHENFQNFIAKLGLRRVKVLSTWIPISIQASHFWQLGYMTDSGSTLTRRNSRWAPSFRSCCCWQHNQYTLIQIDILYRDSCVASIPCVRSVDVTANSNHVQQIGEYYCWRTFLLPNA